MRSKDFTENYINELAEKSAVSARRSVRERGGASAFEASPPFCNTGGKLTVASPTDPGQFDPKENIEVGIDYFRGSFPIENLEGMLEFLQNWYGSFYVGKGGMIGGYAKKFEFACGVKVGFDTDPEMLEYHGRKACIDMTGQAWHSIAGHEHRDLYIGLYNQGAESSRTDVKGRDYKKILDLEFIKEISYKKHFTPDRKFSVRESQGFRKDTIARTLYYGARGTKSRSGLLIRIYDKFLESEGAIDSIDFEVELTDKKGKAVQLQLVSSKDNLEFQSILGGVIASSITFKNRDASANISRCPVYSFWQKFTKELGLADLSVRREISYIEQKLDYIANFQGKTLAMVREFFRLSPAGEYGFELWLNNVVSAGREKMEKKDWAIVAQGLLTQGMPQHEIDELLADRLYETSHMSVTKSTGVPF